MHGIIAIVSHRTDKYPARSLQLVSNLVKGRCPVMRSLMPSQTHIDDTRLAYRICIIINVGYGIGYIGTICRDITFTHQYDVGLGSYSIVRILLGTESTCSHSGHMGTMRLVFDIGTCSKYSFFSGQFHTVPKTHRCFSLSSTLFPHTLDTEIPFCIIESRMSIVETTINDADNTPLTRIRHIQSFACQHRVNQADSPRLVHHITHRSTHLNVSDEIQLRQSSDSRHRDARSHYPFYLKTDLDTQILQCLHVRNTDSMEINIHNVINSSRTCHSLLSMNIMSRKRRNLALPPHRREGEQGCYTD